MSSAANNIKSDLQWFAQVGANFSCITKNQSEVVAVTVSPLK